MVAQLLYLLLALVHEHQLVRYGFVLAFVLDGEIPHTDAVVLTGHCYHGFFVGLEGDRSDRLVVPTEAYQLLEESLLELLEHAEVPHFDCAVVGTACQKV